MKNNIVTVIGDHHSIGGRDVCGFANRLHTELYRLDNCSNFAVLSHGVPGNLRKVSESIPKAVTDTFSYEGDSHCAVLWVGVGDLKAGGIPYAAWESMMEHCISSLLAADLTVYVVTHSWPFDAKFFEDSWKKWVIKINEIKRSLCKKHGVRFIRLDLKSDEFVDLYTIKAKAYQYISYQIAKEITNGSTVKKPSNLNEPEIINRPFRQRVEPVIKSSNNEDQDIGLVLSQPDRIRQLRR
jgi:hypothetical protein